jgi:hypothetical protein
MTRLSRQQHDLSTMMPLVRHEVVEKVHEIGREVLPRSPRNDATLSNAELEQSNDAVATPRQRAQQLRRANVARIDGPGYRDGLSRAHHLDPHASDIVDVGRNHPHRPAWNAGNGSRPHRGRQVLYQIHRHPIVRSPGGDQRATGLEICWHLRSLVILTRIMGFDPASRLVKMP